MFRQQLFESWAPPDAPFSPWAKPVLFANMPTYGARGISALPDLPDVSWAPRPGDHTAIVLDLPGGDSVHTAFALARTGYRPVPLFNTSPGPSAIVNVDRLMNWLADYAGAVEALRLPADAPPVFMLDAERLVGQTLPAPGMFDNRWAVFPQDFPSGNFLLARGITDVLIVRADPGGPRSDLDGVLTRWQRAGLRLFLRTLGLPGSPAPYRPSGSWSWRPWAALALVTLGLRRNSAGGFGSMIPVPTEGGGGWA